MSAALQTPLAFAPTAVDKRVLTYPNLREHQGDAYTGIIEQAVKGVRRMIVMAPCSFGKTIIAAYLACKATDKEKRYLFLVDNLELVGQTLSTFDQCGLNVGVMQGQHERFDLGAPVQIATNQTITKRIKKYPQYFESNPFDVVVVDEAHCRYKALGEVAELYPSAMFVGLTATPWARGLGKFWETVVTTITVPELLAMGWLCPVDVYSHPCPSWAKIKTSGGDYVLSDAAKEYTPHLMADVVATWEKTCADLSTIVFACDRAHARAMASEYQAAGYNFVTVDGSTDATERRELIAGFKSGEIQGLSTCLVAVKGFDATIAGCMVDVQPTKSLSRHYQKIGRIQRIHEGKERSIALDFAGNFIRNGLPTDVLPTTLNDGDPKSASSDTRKDSDAAPLPVSCSNCSMLRPRGVTKCPSCGYQPTPMQQREHEKGVLEILTGDPRTAERIPDSQATKERWYKQMLEYAYRQGYKPGWARHAYAERFNEQPRSATKSTQISADVMQWCENYRRRKAKAYIKKLKAEGKLEPQT